MRSVYIEYLGDSVELPPGETVVGRDVGCALRFNDAAVSRRHVRFVRREDDLFVEDLASSNGTLVNGDKLGAPLRLYDGDKIHVGSRELTVHVTDGERIAAATQLLSNLSEVSEIRITERLIDNSRYIRHATSQQPVTLPPAPQQRCPRCAAPVTEFDDECAACKFQWGGFRPMSHTNVRPNPLTRRHDRHSIELHLVYVSDDMEIEATTRDLSASGVFVCSGVLEPVGTRCRMTILIDGGPPLRVDGIVRRVVEHGNAAQEPIGLGVEFVRVGHSERAWLDALVARSAPKI